LSEQILVLEFAQKYDFANELRSIRYQLKVGLLDLNVDSKWQPDEALILAWMMDDGELCAQILKTTAGRTREKGSKWDEEERFGESIAGAWALDLASCSIQRLKWMPVEMIWALLRASYRPHDQTKEEVEAIANRFQRLMKLEGESSSVGLAFSGYRTGAPKTA
jgi:hypothetical protein